GRLALSGLGSRPQPGSESPPGNRPPGGKLPLDHHPPPPLCSNRSHQIATGRVCLPKAFANATVIIEQVNENELRIRKARVIPEDEMRFSEEAPIVLSDGERERFLRALD